MTHPQEIFTTIEDRWNWDKYIQQVDLINLSAVDREKAKDSFVYLRRVLGEEFLQRAYEEGNPMFSWYFLRGDVRARLSLIRLVEALKASEVSINFRSAMKDIKRHIKTSEDFERLVEKLSMVRVAHKFLKSGFDVEYDPVVKVIGKRGQVRTKKPDLRICDRDNKQEIIVEVSRMKASDNHKLSDRTFHTIWRVLMDEGMCGDPEALKNVTKPRHILPYALIHRGMEDKELKSIVDEIRRKIEHVRTSGEFCEFGDPDTIEIGIASYDNHHLAKEWAARRGLSENDTVVAPWITSNEIARAKSKLTTELKQIPSDQPGIVMLEARENLFFFGYDFTEVANYLGEELKKHPKLLCVVFFHSVDEGGGESYSKQMGVHQFVNNVRNDGSSEQLLIIRNVECPTLLSSSTVEKLECAFRSVG